MNLKVGFISQIKKFWDQLAWPDTEAALTFVAKIVDVSENDSFYSLFLSSTWLQEWFDLYFRTSISVFLSMLTPSVENWNKRSC